MKLLPEGYLSESFAKAASRAPAALEQEGAKAKRAPQGQKNSL